VAAAEEIQQVAEELAGISGFGEALELQLADTAAQEHEDVLIVEQVKLDSSLAQ